MLQPGAGVEELDSEPLWKRDAFKTVLEPGHCFTRWWFFLGQVTLNTHCTVGDCTVHKRTLFLTAVAKVLNHLLGFWFVSHRYDLVNLIVFASCQSQLEVSQVSMRFSVNKGTRTWSLAIILQGLEQ